MCGGIWVGHGIMCIIIIIIVIIVIIVIVINHRHLISIYIFFFLFSLYFRSTSLLHVLLPLLTTLLCFALI